MPQPPMVRRPHARCRHFHEAELISTLMRLFISHTCHFCYLDYTISFPTFAARRFSRYFKTFYLLDEIRYATPVSRAYAIAAAIARRQASQAAIDISSKEVRHFEMPMISPPVSRFLPPIRKTAFAAAAAARRVVQGRHGNEARVHFKRVTANISMPPKD